MARKKKPDPGVFRAEPHRNDNSMIGFGAAVSWAVNQVRRDMAVLARQSNANEYAPGSIHALRKLCEGEKTTHLCTAEVQEWRTAILAWLDRVKESIQPKLYDEFRANIEADLEVLLGACAGSRIGRSPPTPWGFTVSFDSEEAWERAIEAANRKHPVRPGSALEVYLQSCVKRLFDE